MSPAMMPLGSEPLGGGSLEGAADHDPDMAPMRRALQLAARGLDSTDPNPRVGCVLIRDGIVVGEGWHERAGAAHAEVNALRAAGEATRGATAYVSLEPCAHSGRTPPCTEALIAARVARVVYAAEDPNPRVHGRGAKALIAAGVGVRGGVLAEEARALNPGFFKRMQSGLPWVRVKLAASLDGRTALAGGASRWITGEAARADVQHYRARSSVVLSGSGTVLTDDPRLDVRLDAAARQPLRVVLDRELSVSPQARVFAPPGEALVFTASVDATKRAALERCGVRVETAPSAALGEAGGGLALEPVLRRLAALEANEVWVEAGARLAGALLAAGLADELIVYLAPLLLGPAAAPLAQLPAPRQLGEALRLQFVECVTLGEDLRITARPGSARAAEPARGP